ncbi:putative RNA-directed DNA polymerase, eukaryota, reverse transcriptase zinc-binding domain protein [Tanacetum coccineum]
MAWYRKCKKDLMVFKVDFKKAFDSLRWDYLDLIMVNGSPTSVEFEIFSGLRKGSLSHFSFSILAHEGFTCAFFVSESIGLFKGVTFGNENLKISHLIFADDVIFLGDWSRESALNLLCMLWCFYLISGLKINVNKCSILGVRKTDEEVSNLAHLLGCGVAKAPFKYLGVLVGGNMNLCSNWEVVIQKFRSKLSLWKACLLSVGGRLSLIKSVLSSLTIYYMSIYMMPITVQKKLESMRNNFFIGGDMDDKKMTWVRWKKCLENKDLGGLGIGSAILSAVRSLNQKGVYLLAMCVRKVGNGKTCRFWEDIWVGNTSLKLLFPRVYNLDTDKAYAVADRNPIKKLGGFVLDCSSQEVAAELLNLMILHVMTHGIVFSDKSVLGLASLNISSGFSGCVVRTLVASQVDFRPRQNIARFFPRFCSKL